MKTTCHTSQLFALGFSFKHADYIVGIRNEISKVLASANRYALPRESVVRDDSFMGKIL